MNQQQRNARHQKIYLAKFADARSLHMHPDFQCPICCQRKILTFNSSLTSELYFFCWSIGSALLLCILFMQCSAGTAAMALWRRHCARPTRGQSLGLTKAGWAGTRVCIGLGGSSRARPGKFALHIKLLQPCGPWQSRCQRRQAVAGE